MKAGMRVSVKVIIFYRGKYLLLRPRNLQGSIKGWDCPGGTVEVGESLEQTARRELNEETGIQLNKLWYVKSLSFPGVSVHYELYYGESASDKVVLSDEHTGYRWVNAKEARELTGMNLNQEMRKLKRNNVGVDL